MYDNSSVVWELKQPAIALDAVTGDEDRHRFVVGTLSTQADNKVELLELVEETNEVVKVASMRHPSEVLSISTCPANGCWPLLFTCHRSVTDGTGHNLRAQATLWQMVDEERAGKDESDEYWKVFESAKGADESADLATLLSDESVMDEKQQSTVVSPTCESLGLREMWSLPLSEDESVSKVVWNPGKPTKEIMSIGQRTLTLWRIAERFESVECVRSARGLDGLSDGVFDPHSPHSFVSAHGTTVSVWNTLKMGPQCTREWSKAHKKQITGVDFNPNKPHTIVTASKDRCIKVWDLKSKSQAALLVIAGHWHGLRHCQYNRFHDELLVSCSSDATLSLWNLISVSSAPLSELDADSLATDARSLRDCLIKRFKSDYDDSVVRCVWSAKDAWVFASLCFDGRILVHHVPPAVKYQILL